jgi:hypothetical protein
MFDDGGARWKRLEQSQVGRKDLRRFSPATFDLDSGRPSPLHAFRGGGDFMTRQGAFRLARTIHLPYRLYFSLTAASFFQPLVVATEISRHR